MQLTTHDFAGDDAAMNDTNDTNRWVALGRALAGHRTQRGMSKRAAAHAAGFSEATWRQLEAGVRNVSPGIEVEMSARPETVITAASAVGMDPAAALAIVGMAVPEFPASPTRRASSVEADIAAELRLIHEELVRLGAAVAQLATPAPVLPPPAEPSARPAKPSVRGVAR